jgi:putative hydrolase of the HAD superfamily
VLGHLIKAVAFDVDGTLYPNHRMYMASFGFAMKNFRLLNQFREVRHELRRLRPIDDFYAVQAALLARRIGGEAEAARELIQRVFYGDWEKVLHHVNLFPGVIELLSLLKNRGVPLGVLSDFPVVTKLSVLNIENYFDVEMSSEETGYLKPNPEPFEILAERLGVEAKHVLYVGNSYPYDIQGAHALGMSTAHIVRRPPAGSPADFSFTRYAALKDWLLPRLAP